MGVRLAGHATRLDDMVRQSWQDWLASVEGGYSYLKSIVDDIFIIGLSMGGVLSLLFASQFPVSGVVTMSTPYALPHDPRLPFLRVISLFISRVNKGAADWRNPEAALDHVEYPYHPTRGILQLRDLLQTMRTSLPGITSPALIIHSKNDLGVAPQNAELIYNALGARDKQILWVENSGHVIPREPDRWIAFQATEAFIQRVKDRYLSQ